MSETEGKSLTLIRTKLHRPRLRSDLVDRPRLLTQLECGVEHKVTLISAPAGYGKTTLLCQWLETCPHPSVWLSLDGNDSDLAVFDCTGHSRTCTNVQVKDCTFGWCVPRGSVL